MIQMHSKTLTEEDLRDDTKTMALFSIDDVEFRIPRKPRVNIALRYLWEVKTHGEDYAAASLLESLIGTGGFTALMNYDDLDPETLKAILTAAQQVALGSLEDAKGN